ncbi:hydroxyacylglutathione hydrolase [Microbulbifer aestuariivivens]|uniref:Hydroxyacylglutathione hydrolase n=1 Tax=Microbulbifer aestuariivivens TaxID=1908308 RepID=A0ABP9WU39_9GAMM
MFVEPIKSPGLAQISYLIGDACEAAVIDPRRDCEIYIALARQRGCRITHIFETHRNEDLLSGAPILAQLTGASVHHGPDAAGDVRYAQTVREGDDFTFGAMQLRVLETPGHTDDSLSFAIYERGQNEAGTANRAIGVFSGDALFVGDVGRTDFYPERKEEVAGLLYDSLEKILALGDQVILYPAHGAGSTCGGNIADRDFSTLGYERLHNPMLQIRDREKFIASKLAEHHEKPPYFRHMEQLNLVGCRAPAQEMTPALISAADFQRLSAKPPAEKPLVVDVRGVTAYLGAHLPGSLAIPCGMIPAFAGWFLQPDDEFVLVADSPSQAEAACRHLARIGFDRVLGFSDTALPAWAAGARPFDSIAAVDAATVKSRADGGHDNWRILDVRGRKEIAQGIIAGAETIFLGNLPKQLEQLSKERHYTVMCASGARATIAASILRRSGFQKVDVFLGSMGAWRNSGNAVTSPGDE